MADARADDVLRRDAEMRSARANWETHWQEVAERVLPAHASFHSIQRAGGEKLTDKVFDSTAIIALPRFAAAMQSLLIPPTQTWHKLKVDDEELNNDPDVKRYLERVNRVLFGMRYSPRANYQNQAHEELLSMGAFGTGAVFIDDVLGHSVRYKSVFLGELCIAENAGGVVDYASRRYELDARQALEEFGQEALPEKIRTCAEKEPFRKFTFVHCVKPNDQRDERRADSRGMKFSSYHVAEEGRTTVRSRGYRTFPYALARYVKAPGETYARGPAMQVLPDIKTLNEQEKTILRAGQRAVDPPILLYDDGALQPFQTRPGALNYGMVTEQGTPRALPMQTSEKLTLGFELQEGKRKVINDAFLVTLFQILIDTPEMTATEALLRAQEKGALLAPTAGRLQSEMLGPTIEREIDIAAMSGQLPDMPDKLREAGGEYRIEYDSPITRAQRAEEGVGILRTLEAVTPISQVDASVLRKFKFPKIVERLAEINGVPFDCLNTDDEMAALEQDAASQQQLAQLIQAAPAAAGAAKDLASIEQIQASAPRRAIPQ